MTPGAARGFTLIEVLVALVIVAIALGAGIKAAGALTHNAERLAEVSAAQWCAENLLTELRLTQQFPDIGESNFSCEQLGRSYGGKLKVSQTLNPNFRRVDAAVANDQGQPVLSLSTIMGKF
ncbi:MAG: type II secretion system minor pseudopilin GspI [Proteobacteria bacterium]|jgi:general secretion pathway protein I|nr:type II secretion system protein GspI [Methylibium sp.]MBY0369024.1 type II secretion system minor pseudopilin GspI [Burkholderiaceae bacterium]MCH8854794.1 type II secretion system minor pseudopilin GspI [Pseudomonadota bacterium]|mmetsp:Transcript_6022/g.15332  ORF Transcript_6022/g.15332 Transcript_6022/m.15332 type:complete len:122 (-) Transcript_6022:189-554(-)